jgi:hypothetical protein
MANWIHPAYRAIEIYRSIYKSSAGDNSVIAKMDSIIEDWKLADESRNKPKTLLTLFGKGLSVYITLPESLKESVWVYVRNALGEVSSIANQNRIRVTFDDTGALFY